MTMKNSSLQQIAIAIIDKKVKIYPTRILNVRIALESSLISDAFQII